MHPVIMPRQGQSVESCIITKWHKSVGESVALGDPLFSYETDKAAFDEEAKAEGVLLAILREEGEDVPCLETVCVIGAAGEDVSGFMPGAEAQREASAPAAQAAHKPVETIAATAPTHGKISPRAKALAERTGADLSQAGASGPDGRIIARDVQALADAGNVVTPAARGVVADGVAGTGLGGRGTLRDKESPQAAAASAAPETWDEPLPGIRKIIAKAMHQSLSTMAQLTHSASYDATALLALRARCKASGNAFGMAGVTLGDMVLFAVSRTLTQPEHAHLNAHFLGDSMRFFRNVHLGFAVDTPRGLMVPTIRDANTKSLAQISDEVKALAGMCQTGAVDPDKLTGASFTVSNLGALEVEHFTPVINPPQTGILGVGTIQQRVREKDGATQVYPAMTLSLTYDHRALDGAPASRFLRDIKRGLENIELLMGGGMLHV